MRLSSTVEAGDILKQFRFSIRMLAKSPVFTLVAVASLAIGIGANTAIFSLINQLILRLLPVKEPERLVQLIGRGNHYGGNNGPNRLSYPMYVEIRDRNSVFSGMLCYSQKDLSVNFGSGAEHVRGELVSGNYFRVLGVGAAAGRVFTADDDLRQGEHPVAVISYQYWQDHFGLKPDVVGRKVLVDGYPLTVIGVSEPGFDGAEVGRTAQIRVPITMRRELTEPRDWQLNDRRMRWVVTYGRLKPGVSIDHAKASLQPIFHKILQWEVQRPPFAHASDYSKKGFLRMWMDVVPAAKGQSRLRQQFSKALVVLMWIVGFVLLIACANVANLLLARATARQKEMAVRLALGASRRQIIGQLLGESMVLALLGGGCGVLIALWIDRTLIGFLPQDGTLALSSNPDFRVLLFSIAVSLATGFLFGLAPALQSTRPDLAPTLKDQASNVAGGTSIRVRQTLVALQMALSVLLLVGAGLFIRSLANLRELDPGFRTQNMLGFGVDPKLNGYTMERSLQVYKALQDRLIATPGVQSATFAVMAVLTGNEWDNWVTVEGYTPKPGDIPDPHMNFVAPRYFATMGVPILAGRAIDDRDDTNTMQVCVVNQRFAKHYFGGAAAAVGRHIGMGGDPGTKTDITIIGVARDAKYESIRDEIPEEVYEPYRQMRFVTGMQVYVRTEGDPEQMFQRMRAAVRATDANLPFTQLRTLEKQKNLSLITERLVASLSAGFAILASLLAGIGLYGVMSYTVAWRTREIGVRMALGASLMTVVWLVVKEILVLVGIGLAVSLPVTWTISKLLQSQLYGLTPNDPGSLLAAALGLAIVAVSAGYFPARRAAGIDPMLALRWE